MAEEEKVYPAEEQWDKSETEEETEQDMETGEKEEDVYTKEGREKLVEDDEIKPEEEAFMEGEEEKGELAKCANCGKVLSQKKEEVIEREIDDEIFWFCSDKCANEYRK